MAAQRLAAGLAQRMPWLIRRRHIGMLCDYVTPLAAAGWTAETLLRTLDAHNRARGMYAIPPDSQRSPLALLAHQITEAITGPGRIAPAVEAQARGAAAREASARARADALRERQSAADPDSAAAHAATARAALRTRKRAAGR